MSKWEMVRLGDEITQIRGISYKPEDVSDIEDNLHVPVLRAHNIQNDRLNLNNLVYINSNKIKEHQFIRKGDILVCASSGSKELVGKAAQVAEDMRVSFGAFCKLVRAGAKIHQPYLKHYFSSPQYRFIISELSAGANINNLRNEHIDDLIIPLPPLPVQQKVADVLDKASALIEKRKAQIDNLDLLIKSQFIEMFGDPVTNPKGWKICELYEIATSRLGKMLDAKQQTGKYKYPYLANFNVQWFSFDFSDLNEMDFNEADQLEFALKKGDLLICEGGEVGRCAIWKEDIQPCFFQKALHRVRCDTKKVLPEYLARWFYLRSQYNQFKDIVGQATIAHLPVKCPPRIVPVPMLVKG